MSPLVAPDQSSDPRVFAGAVIAHRVMRPKSLPKPFAHSTPLACQRQAVEKKVATLTIQGDIRIFMSEIVESTTIHLFLATPTLWGRRSFFNGKIDSLVDYLCQLWISTISGGGVYFESREAPPKRDFLSSWRFSASQLPSSTSILLHKAARSGRPSCFRSLKHRSWESAPEQNRTVSPPKPASNQGLRWSL